MPNHQGNQEGVRTIYHYAGPPLGGRVPDGPSSSKRPHTCRSPWKGGGAQSLSGDLDPPRAPSYGGIHRSPLQARMRHHQAGETCQTCVRGSQSPQPGKVGSYEIYHGPARLGLSTMPRGDGNGDGQTGSSGFWKPRRVQRGNPFLCVDPSPFRTALRLCGNGA